MFFLFKLKLKKIVAILGGSCSYIDICILLSLHYLVNNDTELPLEVNDFMHMVCPHNYMVLVSSTFKVKLALNLNPFIPQLPKISLAELDCQYSPVWCDNFFISKY